MEIEEWRMEIEEWSAGGGMEVEEWSAGGGMEIEECRMEIWEQDVGCEM